MYCHYIGWCIGKCPSYRGALYSECPLSEVPLYMYKQSTQCVLKSPRDTLVLRLENLRLHLCTCKWLLCVVVLLCCCVAFYILTVACGLFMYKKSPLISENNFHPHFTCVEK